jgi:hypothetical protein
VKLFGNDGPDLRFEAQPAGSSGPPAIMGDAVPEGGVTFAARVTGAGPAAVRPGAYTLFVLRDGAPFLSIPVTADDFSFDFPEAGAGRYRLQLQRDSAIEAVSSPIWIEHTGYPRPRAASPLRVSLVPAYAACASANRRHGPPLAFDSCQPPAPESLALTVGTPDANGRPAAAAGSVRLGVRLGDPRTTADEADVAVDVLASDVREASGLADYAGDLEARLVVRITDRGGPAPVTGADEPATVSDLPLTVPVQCAATEGGEGGRCTTTTTVDALIPGAVSERRRAIWALGQVEVRGPDERPFLRQGLFAP